MSTERGVEYEFRVSGRNDVGHGQEGFARYRTSEGAPSGPPTNVSFRYVARGGPDTTLTSWAQLGQLRRLLRSGRVRARPDSHVNAEITL